MLLLLCWLVGIAITLLIGVAVTVTVLEGLVGNAELAIMACLCG